MQTTNKSRYFFLSILLTCLFSVFGSVLTGCSHLSKKSFDFSALKKQMSEAKPGAVFEIPEGTFYVQDLRLSAKGAPNNPVILRGQGDKTILQGLGGRKGSKNEPSEKNLLPAVLIIEDSDYVVVENLKVTESSGEGIRVWNSQNIVVRGTTIQSTWGKGLGGSGKFLNFLDNQIFDTVLQNEHELVLEDRNNGIIRAWSAAAATWHLPNGDPSSHVIWKNNLILRSWGEGLTALQVTDAQLIGNTVRDTYATAIYIDHAQRVLVQDNQVSQSSRDRISRLENDVAPGIMMAAENYPSMKSFVLKDIQIVGNKISDVSVGVGFWRDLANKSSYNYYCNIQILDNEFSRVSLLPISIQKIDAQNCPANLISRNQIDTPNQAWKKTGKRTTIRLEDPKLWKVFDNQIFD